MLLKCGIDIALLAMPRECVTIINYRIGPFVSNNVLGIVNRIQKVKGSHFNDFPNKANYIASNEIILHRVFPIFVDFSNCL